MQDESLAPILLIEDNEDDARMVERAMKRANVANKLEIISDGADAMDFLQRLPFTPALVLLDMNLPKVDGFQLLAKIRSDERTRELNVVVMLGTETDKEVLRSRGVNENSFIVKPVDETQFLREVHSMRLRWSLY